MFQRIENRLANIVFSRCLTQSLQSLHAHGRILVLPRGVEQGAAHLYVAHRSFEGIEAIQPHTGIEALAVFDHIGKNLPNASVFRITREHHRLFGANLHLNGGRIGTRRR